MLCYHSATLAAAETTGLAVVCGFVENDIGENPMLMLMLMLTPTVLVGLLKGLVGIIGAAPLAW